MEQTKVDQTLLQGAVAYNQGNLQEAETLYKAILEVQPKHPFANHNLGLVAVSMNQTEKALPLFKSAIDVNPNIEQFWLSYIEALITERQFENANLALKKGEEEGVASEKLKTLIQKLASSKAGNTSKGAPSQEEMQELINHYKNERYGDAENLAILLTKQFPKHQFGWKILGVVLGQTDRKPEALVAIQKAIDITPSDAEAHYNLGLVLQALGTLKKAEVTYRRAIALKPDYAEAHSNLGITMQALDKLDEAEENYRRAITLKPDFFEARSNLGNTLQKLGRLEEAEASHRQAITLKPDFAEAHNNLGVTLRGLGRLELAELSFRQAIKLKPDFGEAGSNLGNTLQELGRLEEAEACCKRVLKMQPDYAAAHNNLGITLHALGKLEEAETSYRQAIALKLGFAEAHSNLGITLQELSRLEEAENSYRRAVALNPDLALTHQNLGITLYLNGDIDSALVAMERANDIDPKSKPVRLLMNLFKSQKSSQKSAVSVAEKSNLSSLARLTDNPLILTRAVEAEFIASLYEMRSRGLHEANDARYGNGTCSTDFDLFEDNRGIVRSVAQDLTRIMMEAVNSEIYIDDSFFNILRNGSGTNPHRHINSLDNVKGLFLDKKKYSLAYYLSEGDQNCREPGILKFYDPSEDILPREGMITITPATRRHSSAYAGKKDRVMVGVNFYSL
jgi:tetratricopeptide (TPR) repeat protein